MNNQAIMPVPSTGSLDAYLAYVQQLPLLSPKEEKDLGRRLKKHNDLDAARQLILSHLRFVAKVARGYSGYGLPLNDLIQEGNVGLMKAVKRFDPDKNVRLVSFAIHWIKAEMHEFILKNWRIVKVATTKAQRKLFFNLRKYKKQLNWLTSQEIKNIAEELGVSDKEVTRMEQRLHAHDMSFDMPTHEDEEKSASPQYFLQTSELSPDLSCAKEQTEEIQQQALQQAVSTLEPRSRDIIEKRWLTTDNKATLHDLAESYGVSAERIRQLEKKAMQQLKLAIA